MNEYPVKPIPGTSNPVDDWTKPLGWVLHFRHCCCLMGHYGISFRLIPRSLLDYGWGGY